MQTRVRTAIVVLTLTGVTGIWLVLAPFVSSYQPSGDPGITATIPHIARVRQLRSGARHTNTE